MKNRGFTLVELVIVIAILTIIIVFIPPLFEPDPPSKFENGQSIITKLGSCKGIVVSKPKLDSDRKLYFYEVRVENKLTDGTTKIEKIIVYEDMMEAVENDEMKTKEKPDEPRTND